jgi:hypothetical protein
MDLAYNTLKNSIIQEAYNRTMSTNSTAILIVLTDSCSQNVLELPSVTRTPHFDLKNFLWQPRTCKLQNCSLCSPNLNLLEFVTLLINMKAYHW